MSDQPAVPMFDDQEVRNVKVSLSGTEEGRPGTWPALRLGETALVVASVSCTGVKHATSDEVLVRTDTLTAHEVFVLDSDGMDGADLLHKLRAARKRQLDEFLGTPSLDDQHPDEPEQHG